MTTVENQKAKIILAVQLLVGGTANSGFACDLAEMILGESNFDDIAEKIKQFQNLTTETPQPIAQKDVAVWLNYNKYKGTGKCWIAKIDPRTKKIDSFLDVESVEKRDSYSGDKCFLVPLVEGACYQFRESGSKSNDSNEYKKVENGELVEM